MWGPDKQGMCIQGRVLQARPQRSGVQLINMKPQLLPTVNGELLDLEQEMHYNLK